VSYDADAVPYEADDVPYEADALRQHEFVGSLTLLHQLGLTVDPRSETWIHSR
jgi:hypothetical protein